MILLSISIILLFGIIFSSAFSKFKLPGLLGFLILGMIIGPYGLNLIDPLILELSGTLRLFALIVILIRAGLGINIEKIKKIGMKAFTLSMIPGLIEGFVILFISTQLLGFTWQEGGILGFIIAAVSPAVVVPLMLKIQDQKIGEEKEIPTMILASASIEDVFIITMFTVFLGFGTNSDVNIIESLLNIPISIILGIVFGIILGLITHYLFKKTDFRATIKLLIILSISFAIYELEGVLKDTLSIASLLSIMFIGLTLMEKNEEAGIEMKGKFERLWVFAEMMLFVLVGMIVNTRLAFEAGLIGLLILTVGLMARTLGVFLCLAGSNLYYKEKIFVAISFLPKATVQAAIGAIPLSLGMPNGDIILAISILAVCITAPIGSIGIQLGAKKLIK